MNDSLKKLKEMTEKLPISPHVQTCHQGLRILVVDDDKFHQLLMKKILMKSGYKVSCAMTIKEALGKIKAEKFAVILLDVILPNGNGISFIPKVRTHNPDAGLIIMSAFPTIENQDKAIELGVDSFFPKPFVITDVLEKIECLLRRKRNAT